RRQNRNPHSPRPTPAQTPASPQPAAHRPAAPRFHHRRKGPRGVWSCSITIQYLWFWHGPARHAGVTLPLEGRAGRGASLFYSQIVPSPNLRLKEGEECLVAPGQISTLDPSLPLSGGG